MKNNKGQWNGYQERCLGGDSYFKGFYYNGIEIIYQEFYRINCKSEKRFYI